MSHLFIDPDAPLPIFEQIMGQLVAGIRSGALPPGTRLPPVRQLASDLGVHANTVAKAYKMLEAEGHVVTLGRNGTRVSEPRTRPADDEVGAAAVLLVAAARRQGYSLERLMGALRAAW